MRFLLGLLALLLPAAALAQNDVALESQVLVERVVERPGAEPEIVREAPGVVVPGDSLLFVLSWRNAGAAPVTGFVLTNPMPAAIAYQGSDSADAAVSVDGGANWGRLEALRVREADGAERPAVPADVTHIRWSFARPIAPGESGELVFRGTVK